MATLARFKFSAASQSPIHFSNSQASPALLFVRRGLAVFLPLPAEAFGEGGCSLKPEGAERREAHRNESALGQRGALLGEEKRRAFRRSTRGARFPPMQKAQPQVRASWDVVRIGRYPDCTCPSPAGSLQTGLSAGRVGSRGRPGKWLTKPSAQGPHLAPSNGVTD